MAVEKPTFIENDPSAILADMVAYYEAETGKTLHPGQPEYMICTMFAYREGLIRQAIQEASLMNLVSFSRAPVLDYLGELVGVKRLAAAPATTTIRFTLVDGHGGVTIPAGTRVSSTDGKAVFATLADVNVIAGDNTEDVLVQCTQTGAFANGYVADTITTIIDVQAFLSAATNLTTTASASDQETDDELRERITLAPGSYSNAGSKGAYIFHAKSAHPSVIDVNVISPIPGTVNINVLVAGGIDTPTEVLDAVEAACNDEKIRPLTDTVEAVSPTKIEYDVEVNIVRYADGPTSAEVEANVLAALEAFTLMKASAMGRDVHSSQVIAACMVEGVYSATLVGFSNLVIPEGQYAFCTDITINITGSTTG